MYIIQVKQNPNLENYVDMAEEEEPASAKQKMKQLVGEYQSEGRIVEVKAEAKMQYNDYFDKGQVEKIPEEKIATEENAEKEPEEEEDNIVWAKPPCKGEICVHYDDGECESFANIDDPIINSEGECQGFDSKYKTDSEELKDLPDDAKEIIDVMLDQAMLRGETPTLSQVVDEGIKRHEVYKYFNGYKEACKIAGLEVNSGGRK